MDDHTRACNQAVDHRAQFERAVEPVTMIENSSELCAAGFNLKEVLPPALETDARGGFRTRGTGLRSLEGMGPKGLFCQWTMTQNSGHDVSE